MSGKRKFEEQLAALDALRQPENSAARESALRKALANRNNFVAAKAADLTRDFRLTNLIPNLLEAFDRFFEDPVKNDPQCWAKNAISRALAAFELQDAEVFLRGMRFIQLEPVWGGSSDTAATLRSTCALALVQCRDLREPQLLAHLIDLLNDKDKTVRVETIRAIEQVNSTSGALLLRAQATIGSDEPEVMGACFGGVLRIEGLSAIAWVNRFLVPASRARPGSAHVDEAAEDIAGEAALSIAATHSPQAFETLRTRFAHQHDPWLQSVLLSAIALTRQDAALEFLLDLVKSDGRNSEGAIEALCRSLPSAEVMKRLEELVKGNPRLQRSLDAQRPAR